jgi:hypothetical protein
VLEDPDDPVDGREIRQYSNKNDDQTQKKAFEVQPEEHGGDAQKHDPLGTLHQSNLTIQAQPLGPGPRVTHHQGAAHGQHDHVDHGDVPLLREDVVVEGRQPKVYHDLADSIQRGIVEGPELGGQPALPGHSSVQEVEQPPQEDEEARGPDVILMKEETRGQRHHEPGGCHRVGVDPRPDHPSDERVGDPVHRTPKAFQTYLSH